MFTVSQASRVEAEAKIMPTQDVSPRTIVATTTTTPVHLDLPTLGVPGLKISAVIISTYAISIIIFTALLHKWRYKSRRKSPSIGLVRGPGVTGDLEATMAVRCLSINRVPNWIDSLFGEIVIQKYLKKTGRPVREGNLDIFLNRVYWRCVSPPCSPQPMSRPFLTPFKCFHPRVMSK